MARVPRAIQVIALWTLLSPTLPVGAQHAEPQQSDGAQKLRALLGARKAAPVYPDLDRLERELAEVQGRPGAASIASDALRLGWECLARARRLRRAGKSQASERQKSLAHAALLLASRQVAREHTRRELRVAQRRAAAAERRATAAEQALALSREELEALR